MRFTFVIGSVLSTCFHAFHHRRNRLQTFSFIVIQPIRFYFAIALVGVVCLAIDGHADAATATADPANAVVDASTMTGKVLCGYQGWFNTPCDGEGRGWVHWGHGKMEPGTASVDLWPDMTELSPEERCPSGFLYPDGTPAELFSSYNTATVARHFQWMRDYGIDGVFLQRFASGLRDPRVLKHYRQVLSNVRAGANEYGRVWGLMYDLSGVKSSQMDKVIDDWKFLVDQTHLTTDPRYIHQRGKPVVAVWGLGFNDGRDPLLDAGVRLIRFLKDDPKYGNNTVMIGVPRDWRTRNTPAVPNARMQTLVEAADIVSPWAVGGTPTLAAVPANAGKFWTPDMAWCREHGVDYLPVVFPGFSWHNLKRGAKLNQIPRLGGRLLWAQYVEAKKAGATMVYQAMFDEVDEGTAIFKCTNDPPPGGGKSEFLTYEGLPSDFYLKLVGEGTRLIRGQIRPEDESLIAKTSGR